MLTARDLKMVKNEFSVFRDVLGKGIVGEESFGCASVQAEIRPVRN